MYVKQVERECLSDEALIDERLYESEAQRDKYAEEVQSDWEIYWKLRARINEIRISLPLLALLHTAPLRTRHWKVPYRTALHYSIRYDSIQTLFPPVMSRFQFVK